LAGDVTEDLRLVSAVLFEIRMLITIFNHDLTLIGASSSNKIG